MWMVQFFQSLTLQLQGLHHGCLSRVISIACRLGQFDLLDRHHFTCVGIHGEIHSSICAFAYELTANPFKGCNWSSKSLPMEIMHKTYWEHSMAMNRMELNCSWVVLW